MDLKVINICASPFLLTLTKNGKLDVIGNDLIISYWTSWRHLSASLFFIFQGRKEVNVLSKIVVLWLMLTLTVRSHASLNKRPNPSHNKSFINY